MEQFIISGIQQIGIGTEDFRKSWDWYIDKFGVDVKILEDDTIAERMLPYTGNSPQKRHACIAVNLRGGGGFEIWQYSERQPVSPKFEIAVGDLGIFAAKVYCRNIKAMSRRLAKSWPKFGAPGTLPDGTRCIYVKDLYGNYFQLVESKERFINQNKLTGGIAGAMIGVSDMEKAIRFYQSVLGYDTIVYDQTGKFSDWDILNGYDQTYRRVLLRDSKPTRGAFSGLLNKGTIELVQPLERQPRKIYEGRYWGDPGFIQICYDVTNMKALSQFCQAQGHPFTVDSCPDDKPFDMGEASGHFTYIEDPDGTLIEFVETFKIPIIKKFGWYLDLRNRDREKSLPKFLFQLMGIVSRQKVKKQKR